MRRIPHRLVQLQNRPARRQSRSGKWDLQGSHPLDSLPRLRQRRPGRRRAPFGQFVLPGSTVLGPLSHRPEQNSRFRFPRREGPSGLVPPRLLLNRPLALTRNPPDLTLRRLQSMLRRRPFRRLAPGVEVIATAKGRRAEGRDLHDPVHRAQQASVMADHHSPALPAFQHPGHDPAPFPIQMVGGFVQHQQIRLVHQQGGQPQPRLLAAAQRSGGSGWIKVGQTDLGKRRRNARFQRPVGLRQIVGRAISCQHPPDDRQAGGHAQCIGDAVVPRRADGLLQKADPAGAHDRPLARLGQAGDQAQQRGFAHAIAADDARALTPEGEAQVRE